MKNQVLALILNQKQSEKLLSIDPSGSLKQPHRLRRLLNDPLKSERKPIFYVELSFISGSIFNSFNCIYRLRSSSMRNSSSLYIRTVSSFEFLSLLEIMKKKNTWNVRHLANEQFVPSARRPSEPANYSNTLSQAIKCPQKMLPSSKLHSLRLVLFSVV